MSTTEDLRQRQFAAVARGIGTKSIYAVRAENSELWDASGQRYIDFAAGIAVLNTGHRHPKIISAVREQTKLFTHTCFHVAPYEGYIRLAERLNAIVPITDLAKTMLVSTGAEAVENAVKIARVATGRSAIIAFSGAFHGRTMLGMALTGKVDPYKQGFGPLPSEIYRGIYPNTYLGVSTESAIADLMRLFSVDIEPEQVAAIIVEPIQGEGGFVPAPSAFLVALRNIADQHGILLIADEIQTGFARTGKMFAIEHAEISADIVTLAKGLGGGFPISAVVGRHDVMDSAHVGGLGGTYAGSPISVAAANAVLDVIEEEGLCDRANDIGARIRARLEDIAGQQGMEFIGDIRGRGAMIAMECVRDRTAKAADADLANAIVSEAESRGLILLVCGTRGNVIRFLPPLTIPDDILVEALDILEASIDSVIGTKLDSSGWAF